MYREQLINYLKNQDKPYRINGNEVTFQCPSGTHEDRNPSFSANTKTGACFCFSCGFSTHLGKLLDIKLDEDTIRLSKYLQLDRLWDVEEEPEEVNILLPPVDFYIKESIRGIPSAILEELGVYYCSYGRYRGRLIFPIIDARGNLLGFDARIHEHPNRPDVVPEVPNAKYLRPTNMKTTNILYPIDYISNHPELHTTSITLTEGIFDALSYIALGIPAVCNFGLGSPSVIKASLLLELGISNINNGFDHDEAGISGWQKIKDAWKQYLTVDKPLDITRKIWASGKDANNYIQEIKKC